jgi:hypothetical protein
MNGAIPPLLQYVFMAWCLVKHRDSFTFTFKCKVIPGMKECKEVVELYELKISELFGNIWLASFSGRPVLGSHWTRGGVHPGTSVGIVGKTKEILFPPMEMKPRTSRPYLLYLLIDIYNIIKCSYTTKCYTGLRL